MSGFGFDRLDRGADGRCGTVPRYLTLVGVSSFGFALIFTVNLVYHVRAAGLSPLQLVLVGTALETGV